MPDILPSQLWDRAQSAPRNANFHLVPRYTPGSPAQVPWDTFLHVAQEELGSYEDALTGIFGEEKQKIAETKALSGIAFCRWEKGKKVFRLDIITGVQFEEPPRLNHKDVDRLKDLRNRKQFGESLMTRDQLQELETLEYRNEIHRDKY